MALAPVAEPANGPVTLDSRAGEVTAHRIRTGPQIEARLDGLVQRCDRRGDWFCLRSISLSKLDLVNDGHGLSCLRRLPAAQLKIDASFVQELDSSADARVIVDAVVRLAHALSLRVAAEGVETGRQRDLLVALDCEELQGYLIAKPMAAHALTAWAQLDDDRLDHQQEAGFRPSLFQETSTAPI